jgi:hypothetical protein
VWAEGNVDVLAIHLASGVAYAHRVGSREGQLRIQEWCCPWTAGAPRYSGWPSVPGGRLAGQARVAEARTGFVRPIDWSGGARAGQARRTRRSALTRRGSGPRGPRGTASAGCERSRPGGELGAGPEAGQPLVRVHRAACRTSYGRTERLKAPLSCRIGTNLATSTPLPRTPADKASCHGIVIWHTER